MKRWREGTLEEFQADNADDLEKIARQSICGPADFIRRAEQLVKLLSQAPLSLRARKAQELAAHIGTLRRAPANLEGWIYPAICAAFIYGELAAEVLADAPSKQKGLTRTEYLRHKDAVGRERGWRKKLARLCRMSPEGLREWEKATLR